MARVAQRRSNPPYLVLLLVFLFLVAAALAAIFVNSSGDKQKELDAANARLSELAKPMELNQQKLSPYLSEARKAAGRTVLQQLIDQRDKLLAAIGGGGAADPDQTLKEVAAAKQDSSVQGGLLELVKSLKDEVAAAKQQVAELTSQVASLNESGKAKDKALADSKAATKGDLDKAATETQAAQAKLTEAGDRYRADLDKAQKDAVAKLAEKDRRITGLSAEIQKLMQDVDTKSQMIKVLSDKLGATRPELPQAQLTPSGRIIKVEQDIAYIDIGVRDRVTVGLPFTVYGRDKGVDPAGKGKGRLIVTNVFDNTAECRIVETTAGQPVRDNDLIANVAFHGTRPRTFVVVGEFDLNGDGQVDPGGNQRIKELIRQSGGKVADLVTVGTDFVVMGEEPGAPAKPADNAPAASQENYRGAQATWQAFQDVKKEAVNLNIPILNTNRFLASIGYRAQ